MSRIARLALATLTLSATACGARSTTPMQSLGSPRTPASGSTPASASTPGGANAATSSLETLRSTSQLGQNLNVVYRRGPVAAHLVLASGPAPRALVAFPAGNSGVAVWFERLADGTQLTLEGEVAPVESADGMRGITVVVRSSAPALTVRRAVLSSVRVIRDQFYRPELPPGVAVAPTVDARTGVAWLRRTIDGGHHFALRLEPLDDATARAEGGERVALAARAGSHDPLRFRLTASTDMPALTPIAASALLTPEAAAQADAQTLQTLAFLAYEEKLLAGSWRFLTYFGRDTLMSTRLLMPALQPAVIEAALGSVLERLAPDGGVAHEEDIGEYAAIEHARETPPPRDLLAPIYDHHMVDDDFMLAPVAAEYLLGTPAGTARASAFLSRRTSAGETFAAALRRNLNFVLAAARPYAATPRPSSLVALQPGRAAGDWRDSETGLGGGRYSYSVNAVLVPAALDAAARMLGSPLLANANAANEARTLATAWSHAAEHFQVALTRAEAHRGVSTLSRALGLDPSPALAALTGPVRFAALSLDAAGRPLRVMHSDVGFDLLFLRPSPALLEQAAAQIAQPFPAGLRTPVGIVVANAAYAPDPALRALFTPAHYHGSVVWSWQQALLAAGLARQLAREDLPPTTRTALRTAERELWNVIAATREARNAELWGFRVEQGRAVFAPFDALSTNLSEEANALQLWSTVYLGVRPPAANAP